MTDLEQLQEEARVRHVSLKLYLEFIKPFEKPEKVVIKKEPKLIVGKKPKCTSKHKPLKLAHHSGKIVRDFKKVFKDLLYFQTNYTTDKLPKVIKVKKCEKKKLKRIHVRNFKHVFEGVLSFSRATKYKPEKMKEPKYKMVKQFVDERKIPRKKIKQKPQIDYDKVRKFASGINEVSRKVIINGNVVEIKKGDRPPATYSNKKSLYE